MSTTETTKPGGGISARPYINTTAAYQRPVSREGLKALVGQRVTVTLTYSDKAVADPEFVGSRETTVEGRILTFGALGDDCAALMLAGGHLAFFAAEDINQIAVIA